MESSAVRQSTGTATVWTARVIATIVVLFWLFDSIGHIMKPGPVVDAFARLGVPLHLAPVIGILQLVLLAIYLTPRLSVFGAVLITGYLGGAVAINLRGGAGAFEVVFPIIFAVLVWAPVYLRNERLRAVFPAIK